MIQTARLPIVYNGVWTSEASDANKNIMPYMPRPKDHLLPRLSRHW